MDEIIEYDGRSDYGEPVLRHSYPADPETPDYPGHMMCVYYGPSAIRPLTAVAPRCPRCEAIIAWYDAGEPRPVPDVVTQGMGDHGP